MVFLTDQHQFVIPDHISYQVFVVDGALLSLEVLVQGGTPRTQHDLRIDGMNVGDIELNAGGDGEATIELELADHPQISLNPGTTVSIGSILEGYLVDSVKAGDVDGDGSLNHQDIDAIFAAVATGSSDSRNDVNGDGEVDEQDVEDFLDVVVDITAGDANLDGRFDTVDLIQLFTSGRYESEVVGTANWASGDFNGDGTFDSSDLVLALIKGNYRS